MKKIIGFNDSKVNKLKGSKVAIGVSVLMLITILGCYLISGYWGLLNCAVIDRNTINMGKDFSISKVVNISEGGTLTLDDGNTIDSNKIKGYTKISSGSGTWYSVDEGFLLNEVTFSDIVNIYGSFIPFMLLSYIVVYWCKALGILGFNKKFIFRLVVTLITIWGIVNIWYLFGLF